MTDRFNVTSMKMSMKFFTEIENTLLQTLRNHTQENVNLYKIPSKSVGDIMLTEISWAKNGNYYMDSFVNEVMLHSRQ